VLSQELFDKIPMDNWKSIRKGQGNSKKYMPSLPFPESENSPPELQEKVIKFTKPLKEIQIVSEYLFENADRDPSGIGSECFNVILEQAKK
jgi:hypothetical protein